jgi:glycosyltransferase involved in cell wall biosynthesis
VRKGHEVVVVTTHNQKGNLRRKIDGIEIVYLGTKYTQSMSSFDRIISFVKFALGATMVGFKEDNIDLAIATSTPIFVGLTVIFLRKIKKIPYIFEVRDLWPEAPIQLGWLSNPILVRLSRWFEKKIYRNARKLIGLSPGIVEGIIKAGKIDKKKVFMIPNISKVNDFKPLPKNKSLIKEVGLKEKTFKVIYFGTFGFVHNMDYLLAVLNKLKEQSNIEFLLVGDGSETKKVINYIEKDQIRNVKILNSVSTKKLAQLVNLADVSIITIYNKPIMSTCSPNKFFDSLSAGKPIILNMGGWLGDLLVKNECGFSVSPVNYREFADKIVYLSSHPALVSRMGRNARKLAVEQFSDKILVEKFVNLVGAIDL